MYKVLFKIPLINFNSKINSRVKITDVTFLYRSTYIKFSSKTLCLTTLC